MPPPEARALLVAVGGLVASGKSSVARRVAAHLGAQHLAADTVRAELREHGRPGAWDPDAWGPVYAELLREAEAPLAAERSVVLDGSFRTRASRAAARELARRRGAGFRFVECRADADTLARRLAERDRAEGHPGWVEIAERVAASWESAADLPAGERHTVDTGGDPEGLDRLAAALATRLHEPILSE